MSYPVVLVEDNEVNAEMLARRLERKGYQVHLAADGRAAVELVHAVKPAVVLMDISLPEMDGYEATRRLKASGDTAGIPIIALTAHAMVQERDKCFAAGCDAFETKPIDFQRLVGKIVALAG